MNHSRFVFSLVFKVTTISHELLCYAHYQIAVCHIDDGAEIAELVMTQGSTGGCSL